MVLLKKFLAYIFILAGIIVFAYPFLSDWIRNKEIQKQIDRYKQEINTQNWEDELKRAEEYNVRLAQKGIYFYDAFTEKDTVEGIEYWSLLNMEDTGIMGYISIPSI